MIREPQTKSIAMGELLMKEFPPIKMWLDPFAYEGALGMIYADPGVGKTFFAFWLGLSVAQHTQFMKWPCQAKARVLYIDTELTEQVMYQKLTQAIDSGIGNATGNDFKILCPDSFPDKTVPQLSDLSNHKFYDNEAHDRNLIIIDNLGGIMQTRGNESEEKAWDRVRTWLINQRTQKKCVIIVHHAGKSGDYLGSSKKIQNLNWYVKLSRPNDYSNHDGARFELKWQKDRDFRKDLTDPLLCQLVPDGRGLRWEWKSIANFREEQVIAMHREGMKAKEIADDLGMNIGKVKKIISSDTRIDVSEEVPNIF